MHETQLKPVASLGSLPLALAVHVYWMYAYNSVLLCTQVDVYIKHKTNRTIQACSILRLHCAHVVTVQQVHCQIGTLGVILVGSCGCTCYKQCMCRDQELSVII